MIKCTRSPVQPKLVDYRKHNANKLCNIQYKRIRIYKYSHGCRLFYGFNPFSPSSSFSPPICRAEGDVTDGSIKFSANSESSLDPQKTCGTSANVYILHKTRSDTDFRVHPLPLTQGGSFWRLILKWVSRPKLLNALLSCS